MGRQYFVLFICNYSFLLSRRQLTQPKQFHRRPPRTSAAHGEITELIFIDSPQRGRAPNTYFYSQFYMTPLRNPATGQQYTCAEQVYQEALARVIEEHQCRKKRSGDQSQFERVHSQNVVKEIQGERSSAKRLADMTKEFDLSPVAREVWKGQQARVLDDAVYWKFSQNVDLHNQHLASGRAKFFLAAPGDYICGIGQSKELARRTSATGYGGPT
jgi:predicted NAD-dependent protein-ADP-ribosyltransferase YbiA (DUF1768 family)